MPYNPNPSPQSGNGIYGLVPGPLGLPNPFGDLNTATGGKLPAVNSSVLDALLAQSQGHLSPGTLSAMQDYEAGFAAHSGMPGTNARPGSLIYNRGVRDIGRTAEQQVQDAIRNYSSLIPTMSQTQTVSPALQSEIAATNAVNASAPNPQAAQTYAQQLLDRYLARMRSPVGGGFLGYYNPSGGTGSYRGGGGILNRTTGHDVNNDPVPGVNGVPFPGGGPAAGSGGGGGGASAEDPNWRMWADYFNQTGENPAAYGFDPSIFPMLSSGSGGFANSGDLTGLSNNWLPGPMPEGTQYNPLDDTYNSPYLNSMFGDPFAQFGGE